MTTIDVWTGRAARAAVPEAGVSSGDILMLLGGAVSEGAGGATCALGDALAEVARGVGLTPTRDVVAWGEVHGGRVQGACLDDDLAALAIGAGGRLVVLPRAKPHEAAAERLRERRGRADADGVVGVVTLGEACDAVFDLRSMAWRGALITASRQGAARAGLFEQTRVRSVAALDWSLVRDLAVGLLTTGGQLDERAEFELCFVRDVARRHMGDAALLEWPTDEQLAPYAPEVTLEVLAHVVQSAADGALERVPDYVAMALDRAAQGEHSRASLKLLGAAGRALAAVGDWQGASEVLARALDGWCAISPAESSYALCELLRVEGVRGRAGRVDELATLAEGTLAPHFGRTELAYVALALGRARALVGDWAGANRALATGAIATDTPEHVRTSAHRWRAYVARALGDPEGASRELATLAAFGPTDQYILARLDAEPRDPIETRLLLDQWLLLAPVGAEARRLMGRLAPGRSTRALAHDPAALAALRREYRY